MRMGKKKQPTYRVVAADSHSPRDGRFIEIVGIYGPRSEPSVVQIDNDKAISWLEKGAQPTDTVRKLLEISGAWETFSSAKTPKVAKAKPAAKVAPAKKAPAKAVPAKATAAKKSPASKATAKPAVEPAE
jgi:small subunit ribosomal protein S16